MCMYIFHGLGVPQNGQARHAQFLFWLVQMHYEHLILAFWTGMLYLATENPLVCCSTVMIYYVTLKAVHCWRTLMEGQVCWLQKSNWNLFYWGQGKEGKMISLNLIIENIMVIYFSFCNWISKPSSSGVCTADTSNSETFCNSLVHSWSIVVIG